MIMPTEFDELIARRAERVPLQHLTGRAYFRYLELAVGPGVFVPRPETEVMTGWAVDRAARDGHARHRSRWSVDLGTGSGAIAKALATEVPGAAGARRRALRRTPLRLGRRNLADTGVDAARRRTWPTRCPNWTARSTW